MLNKGKIEDAELDTLIDELKKELKDQGVYKEGSNTAVTILMDGGDILGMDAGDLDKAATIIEDTYKNSIEDKYKTGYLAEHKSISILNIFHSPITENKK